MTLSDELREQVRQRANLTCEYCGVSETDTGDQLTVDHFQPRAKGGAEHLDNLVYCCYRCNLYKADYWPSLPSEPVLWNPRHAPMGTHFLTLADGKLYPITATGEFTVRRLRLNRAPLVAYRLRRRSLTEERQLLRRYLDVLTSLERLSEQQAALLEEQRVLLEDQRAWLRLLREDTE